MNFNRSSACISCSSRFGLLDRKRYCSKCNSVFCSTCLPKERAFVKRICGRCKILCTDPLHRSTVNALRVADLKWFLKSRSISLLAVSEKSELVDLVMLHAPNAVPSSNPAARHVDSSHFERFNRPDESDLLSFSNDTSQSTLQTDARRTSGVYSSQSCPTSPKLSGNSSKESPFTGGSRLEDIKTAEEIPELSIGHLKLILVRNYVDFKGCCEKQELQERVLRLWRDRKELESEADPGSLSLENMCKICWEAPIDCVMLECGHLATCTSCGKQMNECPICRQYVVRVVHTFRA